MRQERNGDLGSKSGLTTHYTLAIGELIRQMERAGSSMQMAISIKVTGLTTRRTDKEPIYMLTALSMSAIGTVTRRMATVKRHIGTDQSIQEPLRMATDMALVS